MSSDFTTPPSKEKKAPRSSAKQESFKKKLKNSRTDTDHCEICNGYYPGDNLEAAHIVDEALRENLLVAYKKDKSLPVSVNDCPNGLLLCAVCHCLFDKRPMPLIRISADGTIFLYGAALQSSIKHLHGTKVRWLDKLGTDKDFPTPVLLDFAMTLKPGANKRLRELADESEEDQDDPEPVKKKTKPAAKKTAAKKPAAKKLTAKKTAAKKPAAKKTTGKKTAAKKTAVK